MKTGSSLAAALAFGALGMLATSIPGHAQSGGGSTMETGSNASGSMKGGSGSGKMQDSRKSKKMKKKM